jgi:Spy/CpxP family protein refolding chaperone
LPLASIPTELETFASTIFERDGSKQFDSVSVEFRVLFGSIPVVSILAAIDSRLKLLGTFTPNVANPFLAITTRLRRNGMIKLKIFLGCAIFFICASAFAQRQGTPGGCPAGATCATNSTRGNDGIYTNGRGRSSTNDVGVADPEQEKILKAARQLELDSDQRTQLDSSLKAQKEESSTLDKSLKEARAALAQALQNGQTSLENEIENLASASAKVQESQLRRWAALYAVLGPDQQRRLLMMPTPLSQATALPGIAQAQ